MARPTMSKTIYMQQLGRGTRKCEGKEDLLVFDFVDNANMFNMPYSLHRLLDIANYHPLEYVLAPTNKKQLDSDMIRKGEKPNAYLDVPIGIDDFQTVDLFNWQNEVKDMLSQIEFTRMVDVQSETVDRYIREGKIIPDMAVPIGEKRSFNYFKEDSVRMYADKYGWDLITASNIKEKFMDFVEKMDMSFSYKPVLLKAIFDHMDTKGGFISDIRHGSIAAKVQTEFEKHNIFHHNDAEYRAWSNSLMYMRNVLDDDDISDEIKLAVEYQIPLTSKRVDFLIAGEDDHGSNNVVVIELKQWEDSGETSRPDVVTAFTGGANRAVCHPCYQAYSYAKIIENFNEDVYRKNIKLQACAYLHNYKESNRRHIDNDRYSDAVSVAPIFLADDVDKLRRFIKTYVKRKDNIDLLMKIDHGKLKPAKALQDSLTSSLGL